MLEMPGHLAMHRTKAPIALRFIVVGSNIAGLATAFALRNAGHSVIVVEKTDGKARSKGAFRSPPNMTMILNQWGLEPALSKASQFCNTFKLHNGATGDFLGSMVMSESFLSHLLANFLFLQHGELHTLLYDLAVDSGVEFRFNTEVADANSQDVSITLKSGEKLEADVIVAADGYDSKIRQIVTGEPEPEDPDLYEKKTWITFIVPADVLRNDEELQSLCDPLLWALWLGDGYILSGNLLTGGREYTMSLVQTYNGPVTENDESWRNFPSLDQFNLDYNKFEPRAQKLFKAAESIASRICRVRSHLETLVCDDARIVLVGEAAHPMMPGGHHTTGMAIEDAQTMGILFSRITRREQVPQFLTAYEEIRQPRVSNIQIHEVGHQAMLMCPAGPPMEQRDAMMKSVLRYEDWEFMDEDTFNTVWGNEVAIASHDATEQVEDWWMQWGSYFDRRNDHRKSVELPSTVHISIS